MEFAEFLNLTKEALSVQDLTKQKFSYSIQQGDTLSQIIFVWNVKLDEDNNSNNLKVVMKGSLTMERVKDIRPVIHQYLDTLLERVTYFEEETRDLKKLTKLLATQRDNAINQFDQLIREKQTLESDLYSKFVEILNEKKKKIRQLKELKNRPNNSNLSASEERESNDSQQENGGLDSTMLQTGESQLAMEQQMLVKSSTSTKFDLSFDHQPTPSLDLLSKHDDEAQNRSLIRKRHQRTLTSSHPNENTSSSSARNADRSTITLVPPYHLKLIKPKKRKRNSEMTSTKLPKKISIANQKEDIIINNDVITSQENMNSQTPFQNRLSEYKISNDDTEVESAKQETNKTKTESIKSTNQQRKQLEDVKNKTINVEQEAMLKRKTRESQSNNGLEHRPVLNNQEKSGKKMPYYHDRFSEESASMQNLSQNFSMTVSTRNYKLKEKHSVSNSPQPLVDIHIDSKQKQKDSSVTKQTSCQDLNLMMQSESNPSELINMIS